MASLNFERHQVQEYIELKVGCTDIEKWKSYKLQLEAYTFTNSDAIILSMLCKEDALSYYVKALLTYLQALKGIRNNHSTWSIVRLYYSIFYLLRCKILLSNHLMVRCSSMHIAKLDVGSRLTSYSPSNASGDHQITVKYAEKLYREGEMNDIILSNNIENDNVYMWAMKHRERVNYQQRYYADPEIDDVLKTTAVYISSGQLKNLFQAYESDNSHTFCFDEDFVMSSVPYYHLSSMFHDIYPSLKSNFGIYLPKIKMCKDIMFELGLDANDIRTFIINHK